MIEELEKKYDEFKSVIDVLPVNTKASKKRKLGYLEEAEKEDKKIVKVLKKELEKRLNQFDNIKVSSNIKKIEEELEKCNILNEWNNYNTPYEKMHLDYYLYQLDRYYKEDLTSVNECIRKILESFNNVNIKLTSKDFDYNIYSKSYIESILNNTPDKDLIDIFEDLYWKNSDIIKLIGLNFRSIYLRYEKKITKYYEDRHKEFLKNHNDNELYQMRLKLNSELNMYIGRDYCLNFNKFKDGDYKLADFNDIEKKISKYFSKESYNYYTLIELYNLLKEYKLLLKYKYLLEDMKTKLNNKKDLKNARNNVLKKLKKEEGKLKKLSSKQGGKKKVDEKWLFDYNTSINTISDLFKELDNANLDNLVFTKLSQDSSILEVFKLICSNYLYFVNKTEENNEELQILNIDEDYEELKEFINNSVFNLINNIALLEEKQMKQIIIDKYKLENITLTIDSLLPDSIDTTIEEIKNLINYEDVIASGINLDDIDLFIEYSKMNNK